MTPGRNPKTPFFSQKGRGSGEIKHQCSSMSTSVSNDDVKPSTSFPLAVTALPSSCCMKGIYTAWYFLPWLVLSSHIFHGTTVHKRHNQSRTHQNCNSLHSSHRGCHHARLHPLHSFHQVTWDYFLHVHQLISAKGRLVNSRVVKKIYMQTWPFK